MNSSDAVLSSEYREATRIALSLQIPIAIICLLILDQGQLARICGIALLAFWMLAAEIALRRPWTPTRMDLWYWRWGFVPCFAAALLFAS
jgi:hypothetical protein